jgi:transcription initiation factor IIE alpha subunit
MEKKQMKTAEILRTINTVLEERKKQIGGLSNQVLEAIKERLENATTA